MLNEIIVTIVIGISVYNFILFIKKGYPSLKLRNTCPKCSSVFKNNLIADPKTGKFPKTWFVSYTNYIQWRECRKCKFQWKTQEKIHSNGGGA